MKILQWIWWATFPLWAMICGGYAIAFAGYGLSLWATKPEPNTLTAVLAFTVAAATAMRDFAKSLPSTDGK